MFARRVSLLLALLVTLLVPVAGFAHPMGNFSVNHYSKISVRPDGIRIQYIIDLAEIPAYQELQKGSITASATDPAVLRFVANRGVELGRGLNLLLGGKALPLHMKSSAVIFPPGAGGLPTMKMGFVYESAYPAAIDRAHASIRYSDGNYPGQAGWKEIVAVGPAGSLLKSSVPATDRSAELTNYPTDLLSSPPQNLEASFEASLPSFAAMPSAATTTKLVATPLPAATRQAPAVPSAKDSRPLKTTDHPDVPLTSRAAAAHAPRSTTISPAPGLTAPGRSHAEVAPVVAAATAPAMQLQANQQQTPVVNSQS